MRFFIFAVMLALLPLRGFAGDVMATQMAMQIPTQMAMQAVAGHSAPTALQAPPAAAALFEAGLSERPSGSTGATGASHTDHQHHESAGASCADEAVAESCHAADSHGESCQSCQACHTVALSPAFTSASPVFASTPLPHVAAAQFASAEAALGQKPPIS